MFMRLPLRSARRFAALLLLLGVMLGGTVDAVACEPVSEIAAATTAGYVPGDQHQLPGDNQHGDCVHGHCHHGVPTIPPLAEQSDLLRVRAEHTLSSTATLVSIPPDSLKRPPRA